MIHAEHRYHLDVAIDTAFDYLADPARDAEWQSGCEHAALRDARPEPGACYDIVFSFMGRRTAFVARITERSAPQDYAFESIEGPFNYRGRYRLEAGSQGGVDVHWQFWVDPGRFFGIIPASLLRKVLVSQVENDVEALRLKLASHTQGTR